MAKVQVGLVKLQVPGGKCTPAPPVGPALGQHGVNIGEFVKRFNEATANRGGVLLPVEISIYQDKSFDFIIKQPPASTLIKMALGLQSGSSVPHKEKVGRLSEDQLAEIAKTKMPDLNTDDIEAAKKIIAGTARSMGVTVGA
ncbi:MAG: 50S ribosomal protein L11 [Planctomycetes bacterium]|nr:50S ribosomal protein L11 [Planctomycetota bacterium]